MLFEPKSEFAVDLYSAVREKLQNRQFLMSMYLIRCAPTPTYEQSLSDKFYRAHTVQNEEFQFL